MKASFRVLRCWNCAPGTVVTGVTWCGGMHVFGMWHKNPSVFSLFIKHVSSSGVHCSLVT